MERDGWRFVGPSLVLVLIGTVGVGRGLDWGWWCVVPGMLAAAAFAFFFRDPERRPPHDPEVVVATADGKILSVIETPEGGLKIDTFLSVFNVHVNRAPVGGIVTVSEHHPGAFKAAYVPDAGAANERHDLAVASPIGLVRSAQIAGILARRIVCRKRVGDAIQMGDRIGLIRFGSRAQVLLPAGFLAKVSVGQAVRAGETVLARRMAPDEVTARGDHA